MSPGLKSITCGPGKLGRSHLLLGSSMIILCCLLAAFVWCFRGTDDSPKTEMPALLGSIGQVQEGDYLLKSIGKDKVLVLKVDYFVVVRRMILHAIPPKSASVEFFPEIDITPTGGELTVPRHVQLSCTQLPKTFASVADAIKSIRSAQKDAHIWQLDNSNRHELRSSVIVDVGQG